MLRLLEEIRKCEVCAPELELGANPILSADEASRVVVIGQAPGKIVHENGILWKDRSGENLRNWMGVGNEIFYNPKKIALIPMGFCYPGSRKGADLPPRKECAPLWHKLLFEKMKNVELILLIGKYAQDYYLPQNKEQTLTEKVKNFQDFLPKYFVLPHPSPRNNIWRSKNAWFEKLVIPKLKEKVKRALN